jgi:hypothetical protein
MGEEKERHVKSSKSDRAHAPLGRYAPLDGRIPEAVCRTFGWRTGQVRGITGMGAVGLVAVDEL